MKLPSDECHNILLKIIQHWFGEWLGAIRQQAITWANFDLDLFCHMTSLVLNELKSMINCCPYSPPTLSLLTHLLFRLEYSWKTGSKHFCWCPGFLGLPAISNHAIHHRAQVSQIFHQKRLQATVPFHVNKWLKVQIYFSFSTKHWAKDLGLS